MITTINNQHTSSYDYNASQVNYWQLDIKKKNKIILTHLAYKLCLQTLFTNFVPLQTTLPTYSK